MDLIDLRKPIRVAPDLAVEVLSPRTATTDRGRKMQMFARYGVREYWILDPETRTVELYTWSGGAYTLAQKTSSEGKVVSAFLRGFIVALDELFDIAAQS
jgi:Uma2 family endonuclease